MTSSGESTAGRRSAPVWPDNLPRRCHGVLVVELGNDPLLGIVAPLFLLGRVPGLGGVDLDTVLAERRAALQQPVNHVRSTP